MLRAIRIPIVVSGNMAVDVVSSITRLDQMWGYMVQAIFTTSGTLGGVLSLETSVSHEEDPEGNVIVAGTWDTVDNSSELLTGAGSFTWDITKSQAPYMRLRYTHTGGDSGALNAFACIKGV